MSNYPEKKNPLPTTTTNTSFRDQNITHSSAHSDRTHALSRLCPRAYTCTLGDLPARSRRSKPDSARRSAMIAVCVCVCGDRARNRWDEQQQQRCQICGSFKRFCYRQSRFSLQLHDSHYSNKYKLEKYTMV